MSQARTSGLWAARMVFAQARQRRKRLPSRGLQKRAPRSSSSGERRGRAQEMPFSAWARLNRQRWMAAERYTRLRPEQRTPVVIKGTPGSGW